MRRTISRIVSCVAVLVLGPSGLAHAGPVTFSFDTAGVCAGLNNGDGAGVIQTYMNCVLGGSYVTVTQSAQSTQRILLRIFLCGLCGLCVDRDFFTCFEYWSRTWIVGVRMSW